MKAQDGEKWTEAHTYEAQARVVLESIPHAGTNGWENAHCSIIAGARYLEGCSLMKLDRPEQAREAFEHAQR